MAGLRLSGWLLLFAASVLWPPDSRAESPAFAVIAGPGVAEHRLSVEDLRLIYLRKLRFWPDGTRIQPVNLPVQHPLRQAFSAAVLGSSPGGLDEYWRERYFHGVLPPHVVDSEQAVRLFVRATPGAVGYVSDCLPRPPLRVLFESGSLPGCSR